MIFTYWDTVFTIINYNQLNFSDALVLHYIEVHLSWPCCFVKIISAILHTLFHSVWMRGHSRTFKTVCCLTQLSSALTYASLEPVSLERSCHPSPSRLWMTIFHWNPTHLEKHRPSDLLQFPTVWENTFFHKSHFQTELSRAYILWNYHGNWARI